MDVECDLLADLGCNATAFCSVEDLRIYPCAWITVVPKILSMQFYILVIIFKW